MSAASFVLRCAVVLASALACGVAPAERADRNRPTLIEADKQAGDDLHQTAVYTGNVVLTRGTLRMTGDRLEAREDPEGYRIAVITATAGKLASYRQRRDSPRPGIDEFVEGYAERIEYDERAETVKLVSRAVLRRLENDQPRDESSGNLLTYDLRNGRFSGEGAGGSAAGDGSDRRVRTIIAPRIDEANGTNAGPTSATPGAAVGAPAAPSVPLKTTPALEPKK